MKHFIALLVLFCTLSTSAQEATKESKEEKVARWAADREELMETRSQFRLGVGLLDIGQNYGGNANIINTKQTPTFSLEYSFRAVDFLEVGAYVGSSFMSYDWKNISGEPNPATPDYHNDFTRFNVGLHLRYSWFNRKWVSLYSSAGVFMSMDFDNISGCSNPSAIAVDDKPYFYPDVVPIGVRVGRRLFGYFEPIGFTGRGVAIMFGIGYKF